MMRQFIALGCALLLPGLLAAQAPEHTAVIVISADVVQRDMAPRHQLSGSLYSERAVLIRSPVTETVERIYFEDGQSVKAGDLLVSLQRGQEQAAVKAAKARLAEARAQFQRLEELRQQQLSSQSDWDLAQATVLAAEADLDEARADLSEREVRAPFDGVLGLKQIAPGDFLSSGQVITQLLDPSQLQVEFELPEALLGLWDQAPRIEVSVPAQNRSGLQAQVVADAQWLNPQTRQLSVRARLIEAPAGLRPGQFAQIELSRGEDGMQMAVPEAALLAREDRRYVFVIEDGKARRVTVETGDRRAGWVAVQKGLSRGQKVVVHGHSKLRDGHSVKVRAHYDGSVPMAVLLRQNNS